MLFTFCDLVQNWCDSTFDTVLHEILISKLEKNGFDGWTTFGIRNWLDGVTQRVVINCSMSKWNLMTSGILQGLVLDPVLFNIFVGDMDSRIKFILSNFADDTKVSGTVDMLEGMDAIQSDLDRVQRWVYANLMNSTRTSTRSCTWVGAIPSTDIDWEMNCMRAALKRRIWGYQCVKHST